MTRRAVVRRKLLTVAELYDQPPLMPMITFVVGVLQQSERWGYAAAARGELPLELVPVGRGRFVRTADVLQYCGLPQVSESAQLPAELITQNGGVESNRQAASTPPPAENAPIHTSTN